MIYFQCDYAEGAHPKLLARLTETNLEQTPGYSTDAYCDRARLLIRRACGTPNAAVHFLVGGTQTNATVISSILRPHQGVLCAETGHIACHETGAVEAYGYKVLTLPEEDGKLSAASVEKACRDHYSNASHEHIVQPGMVYISQPTESGTLYSKAQLEALYAVCRQNDLPLFIDGARLGYGLTSPACDMTLQELAALCDIFYIGGTKCGALFGEAVVITNPALQKDFRYFIKQHGGMFAKGRLLGLQFEALFTDGLYWEICGQAVTHALEIQKAFSGKGVSLWGDSQTNQQFPILTQAQMDYFAKDFAFEVWAPYDKSRTVIRFCTSWATTQGQTDALLQAIAAMPAAE